MSPNSQKDDALLFIQRCVKERKVLWTYHVNMRMKERSISRQMMMDSAADFEIIEQYPEDKYFPSFLVYSRYMGTVFHALFAVDMDNDNVRIVTAYYPDLKIWNDDLKTRRKS